jgi:hypothetical protein
LYSGMTRALPFFLRAAEVEIAGASPQERDASWASHVLIQSMSLFAAL